MDNRYYRYYRYYHSLITFGFYGGKGRLAPQIRDFLNYKDTAVYVELFGGSAAVLLNKVAHSKEIYAEKSLALCAFWKAMSGDDTASELIGRLYDTHFDKEVFDECRECIDNAETSSMQLAELSGVEVLDLALACFVVYNMSRDNGGKQFSKVKFPSNDLYMNKISRLVDVADRFVGVEVIHGDAFVLLADNRFNSADTMLYLDPPYLPEAVPGVYYRHNLDRSGHIRLLECIRDMKSKILLSGYDNELYDKHLHGWQKYELKSYSTVTRQSVKQRTEVLWFNHN